MNRTLRTVLGIGAGEDVQNIDDVLGVASRIFYQTHLFPMVRLHGSVDEIYMTLGSRDGRDIPVLLNAVRRCRDDGWLIECVAIPIRRRDEYENEILAAKHLAEQALREKAEAHAALDRVRHDLEVQRRELVRANEALATLATTDPLTGLKNRRAFDEEIESSVGLSARFGLPLAMLLIDVDRFKRINDSLGHIEGDAVLRAIGEALAAGLRRVDVIARYGGEEFAVLLPGARSSGAIIAAEDARRRVERFPWSRYQVTVSVGVAVLEAGDDARTLVAKADAALYAAKAGGRNRVMALPSAPRIRLSDDDARHREIPSAN